MNEMTPAERVALNTLRASALAKMSDADFANLEAEVASKGLRNLDGWFASEVAKAVEQVLKHPGHADQSVHGGGRRKGGASTSAPASSGGNTSGKFIPEPDDVGFGKPQLDADSQRKQAEAASKVGYGANTAAENMGAHSNELSQKVYGKDGASKRMTPTDGVELMGIQDSLASAAESLTMLSSPNRSGQEKQIARVKTQLKETRRDAVTQLSPAVRGVTLQAIDKHIAEVETLQTTVREAWTGVGGTFEKAVEPVVKHPGHADQSVHGKGKGKSGGTSSSPAPSSGGAPNVQAGEALVAELKSEKQKALDARPKGKVANSQQVHDNTRRHGKMTGAQMIVNRAKTRDEATAELGKIKAQINNKQSQIRLSELLGQEEGAEMAIAAMFGS